MTTCSSKKQHHTHPPNPYSGGHNKSSSELCVSDETNCFPGLAHTKQRNIPSKTLHVIYMCVHQLHMGYQGSNLAPVR